MILWLLVILLWDTSPIKADKVTNNWSDLPSGQWLSSTLVFLPYLDWIASLGGTFPSNLALGSKSPGIFFFISIFKEESQVFVFKQWTWLWFFFLVPHHPSQSNFSYLPLPEIPWTEDPGRLCVVHGVTRAGDNLSTKPPPPPPAQPHSSLSTSDPCDALFLSSALSF